MPSSRQAKPTAAPEPPSTPASPAVFPDPIPGIIPFGSLCVFSGASAVGKTILKSLWCRAFLHGDSILGRATNPPTGVYYLAVDRPWEPTYADIFRVAGIPEIAHYCLMDPAHGPFVHQSWWWRGRTRARPAPTLQLRVI